MTEHDGLAALTACPRCDKAPLKASGDVYRCSACKTDFPSVAGIPWLFAEPDASMGEWRNRLHFALQQLATESQQIRAALGEYAEDSLTHRRLAAQATAKDEHRQQLRELLAPLDLQSSTASVESYLAMRTRLPTDQGIATYYSNIHRDWAWGDEENQASLTVIDSVCGEAALGDTLILGAGAGRLAYDIHRQLDTGVTVAMDFNPLLILVGARVAAGEDIELHEFPLAPKTMDDVAIRRTLKAPAPAGDDFHFVLADALRPPFARHSFDTVVTPWLIDVIDEDLPVLATRINNLLKKGGRWINFGSLAFDHRDAARCYSTEEVLAVVEASGFDAAETREETIPYMCSPASRHGRRETVFAFSATREEDVAQAPRHKALPDWIVTGKEPVPALAAFRSQAMSTQIYAFVMSMIDGKRTIQDMAALMEKQQLMTKEEAIPAIRNFLTRMHDDAQRKAGF
jgi:ubiquinone/menaquinone biosynthesis C-methylase UbiE